MVSLEKGKGGLVNPEIAEAQIDEEAYRILTDFSLQVGIVVDLKDVGLETCSEQREKKGGGLLHSLAEGLRRRVHNLQTFIQHRPARNTAT